MGRKQTGGFAEQLRAENIDANYTLAEPRKGNRYSFRTEEVAAHYTEWPRMSELSEIAPLQGMDEDRGNALVEIVDAELASRMRAYLDPNMGWEHFAPLGKGLARKSAGFEPQSVRAKILIDNSFDPNAIERYVFRPFDNRYCYYTSAPNVWKRHRPELRRAVWKGNSLVLARPTGVAFPEGSPIFLSRSLTARDSMRGHAVAFPIQLRDESESQLFAETGPRANLSKVVRDYLISLGINDPDAGARSASLMWMHALAIGYSPAYISEHTDGIRGDWPRIPLPADRSALEASAELGVWIANLLDMETEIPGVTNGKITPALKKMGLITKLNGTAIDPTGDDLTVTAGWGSFGKNGAVMPGKGKMEGRQYDSDERDAIAVDATALGMTAANASKLLGDRTLDIYLNGSAYWRNIPVNVWEYHIGGYQVAKKWLSYRERDVLGRALKPAEAREITSIVRRLAAIIVLQSRLDTNYKYICSHTFRWPA